MVVALRRHFTVDDFAKMRTTGILTEDDRVELIEGEIYMMSPIGPRHLTVLNRLNKLLLRAVQDSATISPQTRFNLTLPPIHLAIDHIFKGEPLEPG